MRDTGHSVGSSPSQHGEENSVTGSTCRALVRELSSCTHSFSRHLFTSVLLLAGAVITVSTLQMENEDSQELKGIAKAPQWQNLRYYHGLLFT